MAASPSSCGHFRWPNSRVRVWLTVAFHLLCFAIYGYSIAYQATNIPVPSRKPQGRVFGTWKFLTYWNLVTHFVFFAITLFCDFVYPPVKRQAKFKEEPSSSRAVLTTLRDLIYHGIAFPIGMFVVAAFWGIYTVDRDLIYPKAMEPFYPPWLNHSTHTFIAPFLLLEGFLFHHPPPSGNRSLGVLVAFAATYMVWILYLGVVYEVWVYPVLELVSWGFRGVLILCSGLLMLSFHFIGKYIHSNLWAHLGRSGRMRVERKRR